MEYYVLKHTHTFISCLTLEVSNVHCTECKRMNGTMSEVLKEMKYMFRGGNRGVATTPKITEADNNPHFNPYLYSNPNNTSKGGAGGGRRRRKYG